MKDSQDLRILIIDDNVAIHQDFIKILTPTHSTDNLDSLDKELFESEKDKEHFSLPKFYIDTASQGLEGINKVKQAYEKGEPYALAFVDIRMPPGLNGIETIKEIWKITPDIQTIICTAFSDYTWEETIKELGETDNLLILKKPFDTVAVRQLAFALTKKWQLMQANRAYTNLLETQVQERTNTLQQSLSLTRATLDSSIDGILVVNNAGKIVDYNDQFLSMWKMRDKSLKNMDYQSCLEKMADKVESPQGFKEFITTTIKEKEKVTIDSFNLKNEHVFELSSHPQKMGGKIVGRIWSFRDITQRVHLEKKLAYQATHDTLTNLPNRILLRDRLQLAIYGANRKQTLIGLLFFDLDRFKLVNDSLGHNAGDELLKAVAQRLKKMVRKSDTLARLGGDEFILIINDSPSEQDIIKIAGKITELFRKPFYIENREVFMTLSTGISLYPKDGTTVDELLRNADLAMYMAKKSGSNRFHFYTPELNQQAMSRLEKETEIKNALKNKEFYLVYQPQVDLKTNKIFSVEALIRWKHPTKGLLFPLDFIPLAEETDLIIPMGEWVLNAACAQNKEWEEKGLPPVRIAVNVATAQFKQDNFVSTVKKALEKAHLSPEKLEIEITENVLFANEEIMKTINELKALGVQTTLDDFGAGNFSLNYLKFINLDRLKIDKSFIQNISVERSDEVIIQAIINMAQSLNLEVMAEGVETQKQLNFVKEKNCQSVQGFYFGKPMAATDLEHALLKHNLAPTP
jgi:diguanylate cyclase (GGDEF)-like protein/PAS domain S-box-containing protein